MTMAFQYLERGHSNANERQHRLKTKELLKTRTIPSLGPVSVGGLISEEWLDATARTVRLAGFTSNASVLPESHEARTGSVQTARRREKSSRELDIV